MSLSIKITMMCKVLTYEKVFKFLKKFAKTNREMYGKIDIFLSETLPNTKGLLKMSNCTKLKTGSLPLAFG